MTQNFALAALAAAGVSVLIDTRSVVGVTTKPALTAIVKSRGNAG